MILRSLVLRPVIHRPWRFLVTILGVAVGIAAIIATLSSNRAALASFREGVRDIAGEAKLEVTRPGGVDEQLLGRLRYLSEWAVIVPVMEDLAMVPALHDTVRILGVDLLVDQKVRDLNIQEEENLSTEFMEKVLKGQGALLPAELARQMSLKEGDTFEISVNSHPVNVPVVAIFEPERFSSAWDRVVVIDIAWAQELFNRVGSLDRIEFRPRVDIPIDQVFNAVRSSVPNDYQVQEPSERAEQTGRMVRSLEFNLTALSGISLLVGAVLVATTLYTSVIQRRSIIALLRSLGATRRQIAQAILAEAIGIGVLGGLLGIVMGFYGARIALNSVRATLSVVVHGAPTTPIEFSPYFALFGLALGVLTALAASYYPLVEALRTPPIQNLRSEKPEQLHAQDWAISLLSILALFILAGILMRIPPLFDLPIPALLASLMFLLALLVVSSPLIDLGSRLVNRPALHWLGSPLRMAAAALSAGRRRAAWAAGAIGVAVALAVAVSTMVLSFRQTIVDWSNQSMKADVWIRPLSAQTGVQIGRLDPEIIRICTELYGPDAVDPFHLTTAFVNNQEIEFGAGVLNIVKNYGGIPFRDGRTSEEVFTETMETHGAMVNESFANRFGVKEGDVVTLQVPGGEIERRITGVFYDYSSQQGLVLIDRADFLQYYPNLGPTGISLFFPENVDTAAVREELRRALTPRYSVEILLNRQLRQQVLEVFDRTFAITTALQLVSTVVAVIAVLTVLYSLVSERRQDMALLRALGATRLQIGGVVVGQAGLLGAVGSFTGLGVGILIGWILVRIVNLQSFGWTLQFLLPWSTILGIALWVIPASMIAGLAPAWSAASLYPGEVLRDEA